LAWQRKRVLPGGIFVPGASSNTPPGNAPSSPATDVQQRCLACFVFSGLLRLQTCKPIWRVHLQKKQKRFERDWVLAYTGIHATYVQYCPGGIHHFTFGMRKRGKKQDWSGNRLGRLHKNVIALKNAKTNICPQVSCRSTIRFWVTSHF